MENDEETSDKRVQQCVHNGNKDSIKTQTSSSMCFPMMMNQTIKAMFVSFDDE